MSTNGIKLAGILATVLVHGGVLGGMYAMGAHGLGGAPQLGTAPVAIEAGLAIKRKAASGKRSRLPQKEVVQAPRPTVQGASRDAEATPARTEKTREPDFQATMDKFRKIDTGGGADEENQEGADEGSEWGTLDDAKGDPYVGELAGRVTREFDPTKLPGVEGLSALGCVRLNASGQIMARDIAQKTGNPTFDRAVEKSLQRATDMDQPVPGHLNTLLVRQGICFVFKL